MKTRTSSSNIFRDLGFKAEEAEHLKLRAMLMVELEKHIRAKGLTQKKAAKQLGVVQLYVSEITCNKVDKLSLDYLMGLCAKAGLTVAVRLVA